jgi:hypothetical protein
LQSHEFKPRSHQKKKKSFGQGSRGCNEVFKLINSKDTGKPVRALIGGERDRIQEIGVVIQAEGPDGLDQGKWREVRIWRD